MRINGIINGVVLKLAILIGYPMLLFSITDLNQHPINILKFRSVDSITAEKIRDSDVDAQYNLGYVLLLWEKGTTK